MRAIRTSLILIAALAALQACGHSTMTTKAVTPTMTGVVRAASDAGDRERAHQMVWDKFTAEGVNVGIVELQATAKPRVYSYVCAYDRDFPDKFCFYTAKGRVDIEAFEVTLTSRRRGSCHPLDARAK